MSERDYMVIGLIKELLGPRNGSFENLPTDRDPRNEYITGVLAPDMPERDPDDTDADIDEVIEEATDDENQSAEGPVIAPASAFSPALDPKSQPRSIGLSFVIANPAGSPLIDICTTWARYIKKQNGGWQRDPQVKILDALPMKSEARWTVGTDVDLYMRARQQTDGSYRVSLHLINQRRVSDKAETPDFVFQPQIRVHCAAGNLLSVDVAPQQAIQDPLTVEDMQLSMLYRERIALARGFLCGAMWKDIDPERPHSTLIPPQEAPFTWTDRSLVSATDQARFSPADVRTEFIPCYSVEAPETKWTWTAGRSPELHPLVLAETWQPAEIRQRLEPLVEGYEQWIRLQYQRASGLPQYWQAFAHDNLRQCDQVAVRLRAGIEWLIKDEDVRLAFCFANQAIALQSQWASGAARTWRPFQLAFILLNITALADPTHSDRNICDLLWFPTGGGKTEAYLGLAAFTLGLRRLRGSKQKKDDRTGAGVGVLSRYTLRLLTIQQFRRALGIITACEVLRVTHLNDQTRLTGWRPRQCTNNTEFLWGGIRFSVGMWVGGGVTPNNLLPIQFRLPSGKMRHIAGALEILQGLSSRGYEGPDVALRKTAQTTDVEAEGDPAQVLTCPVCHARLAIPEDGLVPDTYTLHFVFNRSVRSQLSASSLDMSPSIIVKKIRLFNHSAPETQTLEITFTVPDQNRLWTRDIDRWWNTIISPTLSAPSTTGDIRLLAARPSRPGYFLCSYTSGQSTAVRNNFEIYCPNPECLLNKTPWAEQVPMRVTATGPSPDPRQSSLFSTNTLLPSTQGLSWQDVPPFAQGGSAQIAERIPIPAYTTDDQVYHRCPSLVIATVDKFARLSFEPRAAALFGNVSHYHSRWGYYRRFAPIRNGSQNSLQEHPSGLPKRPLHVEVPPFRPPTLIIQDELHLLEGPLGSMVGLYETAIDALCEQRFRNGSIGPKYVASTATVRQAKNQVQSLFARSLAQFPPSALDVDDRFFAVTKRDPHPLECTDAGRLYVAVTGPGKGAQTPIVRIWSALLQTAYERKLAGATDELDGYWTLVGYFNALRELAGAAALYRQDIVERLKFNPMPRLLKDYTVELSSRANSLALPGLLEQLNLKWEEDAVLATSMFGTGVDVDRLGLMVVHGQPKTTSAYIQATGRVGRQQGGLVVSFFRVSRPRDLDHYEFFTGYHRMLYRAVEPITVTPFAPRARERGLGPLAVTLLRQAKQLRGIPLQQPWYIEQYVNKTYYSRAYLMATHRRDPEVQALTAIFEERATQQPSGRRPRAGAVSIEMDSELDRWEAIANEQIRSGGNPEDSFVYAESSMTKEPERAVVLGDAQHQLGQLPVAFENAPTSLRDVEVTTQFKE